MPIYQYVCDECGFEFERMQSFHDAPLDTCPECGGSVRRVISPVGVIFKGSGWYITDSRRQISGSKKPAEKPAESTDRSAPATDAGDSATSDPVKKEPAKKEPRPEPPAGSAKERSPA
jgi:putative FmdB family regulatory protein